MDGYLFGLFSDMKNAKFERKIGCFKQSFSINECFGHENKHAEIQICFFLTER